MVCTCHSACTLQNNIYTVLEEWTHGYFCLGYFSSSTHFYLVKGLARKVRRQCVLVFAHDRFSWRKLQRSPCETPCLVLSTGSRYLFLLQRRLIPFDSLSLLLIQFSHVWRHSFLIEVSDLYSSSPLFFQLLIVGNRHLLMNLNLVQFQNIFELIRLTYPQF